MSYEPTNWKDGDLVTSAKLNKLEQGVAAGGGITFVEMDSKSNTYTLNKTWQEIYDAAKSGVVYLKIIRESNPGSLSVPIPISINNTIINNPLIQITYRENSLSAYLVKFNDIDGSDLPTTFQAESADDYPTYEPQSN